MESKEDDVLAEQASSVVPPLPSIAGCDREDVDLATGKEDQEGLPGRTRFFPGRRLTSSLKTQLTMFILDLGGGRSRSAVARYITGSINSVTFSTSRTTVAL